MRGPVRATVLALAVLVGLPVSAHADEYDVEKPNLPSDGHKTNGYIAVLLGGVGMDTYGDSAGREPAEYGGSVWGMTMRVEQVDLLTRLGSAFGATLELDARVFSSATISLDGESFAEAPDVPPLWRFYFGITPAIAVALFQRERVTVAAELGFPLNTDFHGYSAGLYSRLRWFSFGWRVRAGHGWGRQEVLDEQVRIGVYTGSWYVGLEIVDGYSEDKMGNANLRSILKGSYTMGSLVLGWGE